MKKFLCFVLTILLSATIIAIVASEATAASSPQKFYKRKTMKFMVPFSPGGGFDTYARALTPYLKKYLGVKNVVIINKPGAGGNIAYNELYNSIKPDGLTICLAQGETLAYNKLWGLPAAKYAPEEFSFLGRVVWEESCTLLGTKSAYKSLEDLRKADVVKAACPGIEDKSGTCVSSAFYALGLKNLKKVVGYGGSREALAAALKGEADIAPGYSVGGIMKFVKAGKLVPLWIEATERHPRLPDTPSVYELGVVKGHEKPLNLYVKSLQLGRIIIAPPAISQDRLRFLADAVAKAIQDPAYSKDLKGMKREMARFLAGDKCRGLMKQIVGISKEEKKELKDLVFQKGSR